MSDQLTSKRASRSKFKVSLPHLLVGMGVGLIGIYLLYLGVTFRPPNFTELESVTTAQASEERSPEPVRITIPWYVDTSIRPAFFAGGKWSTDANSASYVMQSSRPGEGGNIIVYGHNTGKVMGNIRSLKGSETITLTTKDGRKYQYQVISLHEVTSNKTEFLGPTESEILTLYTCSGFMDANRFIVRAEPV